METQTQAVEPKTRQGCEYWAGAESVPRVLELLELGATVSAVARRFGVDRKTIYNNLPQGHKKKAPATDQSDTGRLSEAENRQGDDTP